MSHSLERRGWSKKKRKVKPTSLNAWKTCLSVCGSQTSSPVCFPLILQASSQGCHSTNRYRQVLWALWSEDVTWGTSQQSFSGKLCSRWSASDPWLINEFTGGWSIPKTAEYLQLPRAVGMHQLHVQVRQGVPGTAYLGISKFKAGAKNLGEKICRT